MKIASKTNKIIEGNYGKPILTDFYFKPDNNPKPVVIYCHGYKGFKDWGANDQIAERFAQNNCMFIKFNFSYNGGTVEQPVDFPDLEAFANNNFTKELDDLELVLDWVKSKKAYAEEMETDDITVIGHSRGSGIAIIKASEDSRIKKVVSMAGISNYSSRFPEGEILEDWKAKGVAYIENSRTKQQMPLYFQLYEDFDANRNRLNIKRAASELDIPHLILHGTEDPTVPLKEAKEVHSWSKNSKLEIIEGADHTFNAKHPWERESMPDHLEQAVEKAINFVLRH